MILFKVMSIISEELNYWIGLTDFADGDYYIAIITMSSIEPMKAKFSPDRLLCHINAMLTTFPTLNGDYTKT